MKILSVNKFKFNYKPSTTNPVEKHVSKPINTVVPALMATSTVAAIKAVNMSKTPLYSDLEIKLNKMGYKKMENGTLSRDNFTDREKAPYIEQYKTHVDIVMQNITDLSPDDITNLKKFLDIDPKMGQKMYKNNFENLVNTFCILKFNNKLNTVNNKNVYQTVSNIINNEMDLKTQKSLLDYKGKAYEGGVATQAQKYLRGQGELTPEIKNFIDNISSYMETQKLPEGMKLYRGERYGVLSNVKLENGETVNLGQMMKTAAENKNYDEIKKVQEFILDNKIEANQNGFMSTSFEREGEFERKGWIFWELETEQNTKGIYLEGMNTSFYSFQDEVLLQKNSKIKIKDARYDSNNGIWYLKGKVSN